MSSGFSGGVNGGAPIFFTAAGSLSGQSSFTNNNSQNLHWSNLAGVSSDPSSPIINGKRTLTEFQTQNLQQHQKQNQQLMDLYFRSVKPRIYQNSSPISPLPPIDFSGSSSYTAANLIGRYETPKIQQLQSQQMNSYSYPNLVHEKSTARDSEMEKMKMMMNQLQDLEKELLDDDDDDTIDTNHHYHDISLFNGTSEWSDDTIKSLITSSSSTSTMSSKQSLMEAAYAISEAKIETATEIITRLSNQSPEQKIVHYMTAALKSRLSLTEISSPASEIFSKEQMEATELLFQHSSPFEFGFMAANLAIIEAIEDSKTLHIVDFNIGHGLQYQNLLQLPSLWKSRKSGKPLLVKITAVEVEDDNVNGGDTEKFIIIGKKLTQIGEQVGIKIQFNNTSTKFSDLTRESLNCGLEEVLVVNFAYTLFKMADESVSTENPRDQLLRRVKGLEPRVVTLVEQEMNCNTAQFVFRVNECYSYYGALFDSLDSSMAGNDSERVMIEEGLGRKICNAVAREGKERVERCEVFGKWRARMCMAGFKPEPVSQLVNESLRVKVNSGTRGNPGFMVKEENGGVGFGWMGKILTIASTWR